MDQDEDEEDEDEDEHDSSDLQNATNHSSITEINEDSSSS